MLDIEVLSGPLILLVISKFKVRQAIDKPSFRTYILIAPEIVQGFDQTKNLYQSFPPTEGMIKSLKCCTFEHSFLTQQ